MLSLLLVGETNTSGTLAESVSSLELLYARDAEEAVEKLGRNRRIDAVVLLSPRNAAAIVAAIREDILAPPPIFLPAGAPEIPPALRLAATEPARLVELAVGALENPGGASDEKSPAGGSGPTA